MLLATVLFAVGTWSTLLVSFLVLLLAIVIVAAIVIFILRRFNVAPIGENIVYAICGIILLIWVLRNVIPALGFNF